MVSSDNEGKTISTEEELDEFLDEMEEIGDIFRSCKDMARYFDALAMGKWEFTDKISDGSIIIVATSENNVICEFSKNFDVKFDEVVVTFPDIEGQFYWSFDAFMSAYYIWNHYNKINNKAI